MRFTQNTVSWPQPFNSLKARSHCAVYSKHCLLTTTFQFTESKETGCRIKPDLSACLLSTLPLAKTHLVWGTYFLRLSVLKNYKFKHETVGYNMDLFIQIEQNQCAYFPENCVWQVTNRMYCWCSLCSLYLHAWQVSYRRWLRSLLLNSSAKLTPLCL